MKTRKSQKKLPLLRIEYAWFSDKKGNCVSEEEIYNPEYDPWIVYWANMPTHKISTYNFYKSFSYHLLYHSKTERIFWRRIFDDKPKWREVKKGRLVYKTVLHNMDKHKPSFSQEFDARTLHPYYVGAINTKKQRRTNAL